VNLQNYRAIFMTVTGILALLVASPALSRLLVLPRTEFFTELSILGPSHTAANYPYNISRNHHYSIFLGIGDHLGYCAYYLVEVKFRNMTQSAPTSFGPPANRTPSTLPSLYNITAFVADEGVWEKPLTFSFDYAYNDMLSQIEFGSLRFNDVVLNVTGYRAAWDPMGKGVFGYLFFELWLYNATSSSFQYHERFVALRLNMTLT
jgi:hypothetical protein